MTKNKKFSLILSLLLCMLLAFGSLGLMSIGKASAASYDFIGEGGASANGNLNTKYFNHWKNGQGQRVSGETSGKWYFGYGDAGTSTTYSFTQANFTSLNDTDNNSEYKTNSSHQFTYQIDVSTRSYPGKKTQSMFVWEAESKGNVYFNGIFSKATSDKQDLGGTQNNVDKLWIGGNWGADQFKWIDGQSYTWTIYKVSDSTTTIIKEQTFTSEYVYLIPQDKISVESGDKIVFGLKCNNSYGSQVTVNGAEQDFNEWNTNTFCALTSVFTEQSANVVKRTLTVNCGANGTSSIATQTVDNNTPVGPITITANTGYVIDTLTWAGSTVSDASGKTTYSLGSKTITADTTLSVTFKKATYKVTVTNDTDKGTVSGITNGESKEYDVSVSVTITPKSGYEIVTAKWNGNDITGFNKAGFSFTKKISESNELIVTYNEIKYAVTVTNDNNKGTVTGVTNGTEYKMGQSLTIKVAPKTGYKVVSVKWNGTSVTSNFNEAGFSFTQKIDKASTLEVTYEQVKYSVIVTNDNSKGTVTGISSGEYAMGTVLQITIVPKSGYKVEGVNWGNAYYSANDPSNMTVNIEVDGAKTFTVDYVKDQSSGEDETPTVTKKYNVSVSFDKTMGTVSGVGTFEEGKDFNVIIKAKEGYKIKSITLNSTNLKVKDDKKFTYSEQLTGNMNFEVEFEKDAYETTYNENGYACLNTINGGEYIAIATLAFAVAGLVILKLKKKEQ